MEHPIASRVADAFLLSYGWTPQEILIAHYESVARRARTAGDRGRAVEAREAVAMPGVMEFVKDVATATGIGVLDLLSLLRDSRVAKVFGAVGWSFKKLYEILKKGYKAYRDILNAVSEYLAQTRVGKWTTEELKKLDSWLQKHPKIKRLSGALLAALIVFMWFRMAFTGDFEWDFDLSDVSNALSGSASWSDIFGGPGGMKFLLAVAVGSAVGLSFPWPGPTTVHFIGSIIYSLAKAVRKKMTKTRVPVEQQVEGVSGGV